MAEVFLDGFDIVAALDRGHRIGMPQIVETGLRQAKLGHNALEAIVHGTVREAAAGLIGKARGTPITSPVSPLAVRI